MKGYLEGVIIGLVLVSGFLLYTVSGLAHRLEMAIIVQQSMQEQLDRLTSERP